MIESMNCQKLKLIELVLEEVRSVACCIVLQCGRDNAQNLKKRLINFDLLHFM